MLPIRNHQHWHPWAVHAYGAHAKLFNGKNRIVCVFREFHAEQTALVQYYAKNVLKMGRTALQFTQSSI